MMITRADLKRFAPRAKAEYIDALMAGMETLREAGILESEHRLCHFMAQVGHETGGFTIIRESMKYTPKRMREVWPSRFRNKPDSDLRRICSDPVLMGDTVYGGRMGNRKGTSDGYDYRGGGFIQTTGKYAVEKYAKLLGIEPHAGLLDDLGVCLKFAALEWKQSGCNEWSDENDLTKVCKAINTGSATSNIKPVGMADRQKWFAKAWGIWGDKGKPDVPNDEGMTIKQKIGVVVGVPTGAVVVKVGEKALDAAITDPIGSLNYVSSAQVPVTKILSGITLTGMVVPILIMAAFVAAAFFMGRKNV